MKKILFVFVALLFNISFVNAKDIIFNNKKFQKKVNSFELMTPVKLINPINEKLGLEAGGPKYEIFNNVQKKSIKPVVKDLKITENVITPSSKKVENFVVSSEVSLENSEKVKDEIKSVENVEKQVENMELSQTDKNIDEAKKLLKIAEKLANSMVEENDKEIIVDNTKDIENVSKFEKAVNNVSVLNMNAVRKPKFVLNFSDEKEELKKSDEKKLLDLVPMLIANPDTTIKIVSYYLQSGDRNLAFSRLLNARKVLLEKGVSTSQIMIMVLEDEVKNPPKKNLIEIFLVSAI